MEYLFIYLYGVSSGLSVALFCIGMVFIVWTVGILIDWWVSWDTDRKDADTKKDRWIKIRGKLILGCVLPILLSTLIPSKESMRIMAAVYIGQAVISNEKVQEVSSNAIEVLNNFLKEELARQQSE